MDTGESIEAWQSRWNEGRIGFHKGKVHEMLPVYIDQLTNNKNRCRIFVPLCGKSIDMIWLYERGHEVVGVEAVEDAVLAFFQEQNLKYLVHDVPGLPDAKLYQNEDGRIKVYRSNLFDLNRSILGGLDVVWDRGSMVAIGPCDRIKYSELMCSLMEKGGRILLESYLYDKDQFQWKNHSPFTISENEIKALYEPKAQVQLLHTRDVLYDEFKKAGLEWMSAIMVLLIFS